MYIGCLVYEQSTETLWELCIPFQSKPVMKYTLRLIDNFSIYTRIVSFSCRRCMCYEYTLWCVMLAMNGIPYTEGITTCTKHGPKGMNLRLSMPG